MTPFYARWFGTFFPDTAPEEPLSTCSNCSMVGCTSKESKDPGPFDPNLKCCTYFPFLPNFSIATLVHDRNAAGMKLLESAPVDGVLTPLGLFPDGNRRFRQSESDDFGRDPKLKCPFLSAGRCQIWNQRPSVCVSYHCLSTQKDIGFQYWWTHEQLGNQLEWILAHEILWRIGFTEEETGAMIEAAQDGQDENDIDACWFEWKGRKAELFDKIREVALTITPEELRSLAGDEGLMLSNDLKELRKSF